MNVSEFFSKLHEVVGDKEDCDLYFTVGEQEEYFLPTSMKLTYSFDEDSDKEHFTINLE